MIESLSASQSLAASNYAVRGRAHRDLPDPILAEQWIAAFRAVVKAPGRTDLRDIERDLSAEFRLRHIDPPYHAVEEDREQLIAQIADSLEFLRVSLPEAFKTVRAGVGIAAPTATCAKTH